MANEVIPSNIQIPAHIQARLGQPSKLANAIGGGLGTGEAVPRISIKGARFRLVEGSAETVLKSTEISVVIVGANPKVSKLWYAKPWNPDDEPAAPDCYSLDGVSPHPDSTQPQNDLCATCQWNVWGSRTTDSGQKLKACVDQKRLAVVSADDPLGTVYLLQVTPAALKGLNNYHRELTIRNIAPEIVKTIVGFDTSASFPKLTFAFGGFLDEDTINSLNDVFGSQKVLEITGEIQPAATKTPEVQPQPKPLLVREAPVTQATQSTVTEGKGFKAQAVTPPTPPAPKPTPKEDKPAQVVSNAGLADEISKLLEGMNTDDTPTA